jgi:hypothetical protein
MLYFSNLNILTLIEVDNAQIYLPFGYLNNFLIGDIDYLLYVDWREN